MKSGIRVGIIVDNPIRDLPGSVLIARELAQLGVESVLVPLYQQGTDIPLMGLDAVLLNYARLNNLPLMQTYRELGISLFVLDTEGGVLSQGGADSPENWARSVKRNRIHELLDGYFFWGKRVHEAFVRYSGIGTEKLHVTGPPRYDLCAPRWKSLLGHHRQDYVLINTNFSAVNPLFSETAEAELSAFKASGWETDYVQRLLLDLKVVLERYLDELSRLTRDNPGLQFVVRPHPFESHELYRQRFEGQQNVTVEPKGSIFNVIKNAACVLHLNCGTAVESVLLGKLPISLEYLNTEIQQRHTPLPSNISFKVGSYQQLNQTINSLNQTEREFDFEGVRREHIRPWFHDVDGLASRRVAQILLSSLNRCSHGGHRPGWTASLRSSSRNPSLSQHLQGITNNMLGSKWGAAVRNIVNPQWRHKGFNAGEVRNLFNAFNRVEEEGERYHVAVELARHPLTRMPLASIHCIPALGDPS